MVPARHSGVQLSRRMVALLAVLVVAALLILSGTLHEQVVAGIQAAEPVITANPVLGTALFVGLAALSAILMFFSGLLLVPVGVEVWGEVGCFLLLWSGWTLGGLLTYSIGRHLGRPVVERLVRAETLARYQDRIPAAGSFRTAFLVQLAVPSDVSGYLFGLLRYPPVTYFPALILAELPYAVGTVFLGNAFVEGQFWLVPAAALLLLGVVALAARARRRQA